MLFLLFSLLYVFGFAKGCFGVNTLQYSHSEGWKDILLEIEQALFRVQMMGLLVNFLWVPEHSGIIWNELSDKKEIEATKYSNVSN